jgi:hypothetical protein
MAYLLSCIHVGSRSTDGCSVCRAILVFHEQYRPGHLGGGIVALSLCSGLSNKLRFYHLVYAQACVRYLHTWCRAAWPSGSLANIFQGFHLTPSLGGLALQWRAWQGRHKPRP